MYQSSNSLYAVVAAYNGEAWIDGCIRHLLASHPRPSIVVVDNASTDSTASRCAAYSDVHVIRNHENLGFGRANNIGVAYALDRGAAAVLLVNQDANIEPAMIESLGSAMAADNSIGIATPMQWTEDGSALDATFLRFYLAEHAAPLISDALLGKVKPTYLVESTPAAVWLCSRQLLLSVGGFDPLFFMYCEDDDFCRRARRHGFQVAVVPAARFRHLRSAHAAASAATWLSRLRRRRIRATSVFLLIALDVRGNLIVQAWRAAVVTIGNGISSCLRQADWLALVAGSWALLAGMSSLITIAAHRAQSAARGPHWLK